MYVQRINFGHSQQICGIRICITGVRVVPGYGADRIPLPLEPLYQLAANQENGGEPFIALQNCKLILNPFPYRLRKRAAVLYPEPLPAEVCYGLIRAGQNGLKTLFVLRENLDSTAEIRQTVGSMNDGFFR